MICTLTAVSPSHRSVKSVSADWSNLKNPVVALNIAFICLALVGFAYYIAGVNSMASGEYRISSERAKIAKLTEAQSTLISEKSLTENPVSALIFAQAQNMTEAKDIVYVFENSNVALQR